MSKPTTAAELRTRILAAPREDTGWITADDLGYLSMLAVSEPYLTTVERRERVERRRAARAAYDQAMAQPTPPPLIVQHYPQENT